jgi:hypothetical protein
MVVGDEVALQPVAIRHVGKALLDGVDEVVCEGYTLELLSRGEVRPAQKLYVLKVGDTVKVSSGHFGLGIGEGVRKLSVDSWIAVVNLRRCVRGVQGRTACAGAGCADCGGCSVARFCSPGRAGRMLMSLKRTQDVVCAGNGPWAIERILQENFAQGRCYVYGMRRKNEVTKGRDSLCRADKSLCTVGCLTECRGGRCDIRRTRDVFAL